MKYEVGLWREIDLVFEIEADSEEEAIEKAEKEFDEKLIHGSEMNEGAYPTCELLEEEEYEEN